MCGIQPALIKEMLSVSVPSSAGRVIEVFALLAFFRIMALAGNEALTQATMVQSFYLLTVFCVDAMAKGVTSVVSNLVGANKHSLIPKVIRAGLKVHACVFCVVSLICFSLCENIYSFILHDNDLNMMQQAEFTWVLKISLGWMCLFLLLDGYSWIMS